MKKYINQVEMNKIAKTALAMVLAGSFTFTSTQAFANDTTVENNTQTVEAPTGTAVTNVVEATNNEVVIETKTETNTDVKTPNLIPGDFFYFAKLMIEKIKLVITTNDVKEAQLLATFASERLAEAEILFAEGKEDLALETIAKALEDMKTADTVVTEEKETVTTEETKAPAGTVVVETKVETDTTVNTTTETDGTKVEAPTTEAPATEVPVVEAPKTEAPTTEAPVTEVPKVEAPTNDEEALKEVELMISQNIIALTAAMEKVKNPVAKAALQRNIEKSYAKLQKKIAKIESKLVKEVEETEVVEEKKENTETVKEQEKTAATETEVKASTEVKVSTEVESTTTTTETKVETESKSTVVLPSVKDVKAEEKKAKAALKEEVKKKKQEAKKELKEKREEAKKVMKENKGKSEEKKNDKN
jgi:hypothetical protein